MRLIYEDGEKEKIESEYKDACIKIFNMGENHTYSLDFKVKNPAIAEYILMSLMNDRLKTLDLGIDVTSINFHSKNIDVDNLKYELNKLIDEYI